MKKIDSEIVVEWIEKNPKDYEKLVIDVFKKSCLDNNVLPKKKLKEICNVENEIYGTKVTF